MTSSSYCVFSLLLIITTLRCSDGYFIKEPQDGLIFAGRSSTLSLTCLTDSTETTYSWRKNDARLDTSDASKYRTAGGTLDIKNPTELDQGKYQCVARNNDGTVVSNYGTLKYAYINDFSATEQNMQLTETQGNGIEISCAGADYYPPDQVQIYWVRTNQFGILNAPGNNRHYISPKTGNLYFSSLEMENSDGYKCELRSKWHQSGGDPIIETSQTTHTLTVSSGGNKLSPRFVLLPVDTIAEPGKTVLFECYAGGNPVPTITWSKVGGELPTSDVTVTDAGQLLLNKTTEDMAGIYKCTAENSEDVIEATAELTFQFSPQWSVELSARKSVDLSTQIEMQCDAAAVPMPDYKWLKNGEILSNSEKFELTNKNGGTTLTVKNAADADSGMYQCIAHNQYGYIFSSTKLEVISYAPEFKERVPDKTITHDGTEVTINCVVSGAPTPEFSWLHDNANVTIDQQKYSLLSSGSLKIHNVVKEDEGEYTCKASNTLGEIKSSGILQVFEATRITTEPEDLEMEEGDTGTLKCAASYDPELSLLWKWMQDDKELSFSPTYDIQGSSLTLRNVGSAQTGRYQCCAETEVNKACADARVAVVARPDPPSNVKVKSSLQMSQVVIWDEPNNHGAEITSYRLERKSEYEDDWVVMETDGVINNTIYLVNDLMPYNGYSYRVAALNKIGMSEVSERSAVMNTLVGTPGQAPTNVGGGGGKPGQLIVTWTPIEEMFYGAEDISYEVEYSELGNHTLDEKIATVSGGKSSKTNISIDASKINVPFNVKVRAMNEHSDGPYSEMISVYSAELPPTTAPTEFRLHEFYAFSAEVGWNEVRDENGYTKEYKVEVCYYEYRNCDNPDEIIRVTTESDQPRIWIEDLEAYSKYKLRAAAVNLGGDGPWSSNWTDAFEFETAGLPPNEAPSGVVIHVKDKTIMATWNPIGDGQPDNRLRGYYVEYWFENSTSAESDYKATSNTEIAFDLPYETDYMVWVRGYNNGGPGRPSSPVAISTRLGTSAKYEGDSAHAIKISFTLFLSAAILWLFLFITQ